MFEFILILFGTFTVLGLFFTIGLFFDGRPFVFILIITLFFIAIETGAIYMNSNKLKENEANKKYEIVIGQVESLSKKAITINDEEFTFDGTAVNYLDYKDLKIDDVVACYYLKGYSMRKFIVKIDKIVQEGD